MAPDPTHPGAPGAETADQPSPALDAPPDYEANLVAAADDLERKDELADKARELRDDWIYKAVVDGRFSWSTVARWCRMSRSHVGDVLGNPKVRARVLGEAAVDVDDVDAG